MNKRQKLVQQQFLNDEEKVIKRLNAVYKQSLSDITDKIKVLDKSIGELQEVIDFVDEYGVSDYIAKAYFHGKRYVAPNEAKEKLQSMLQSKVYQKNYQQALEKQVGGVLDKMKVKQFTTVSEYLDECYTNGFVGTMFDLHGQGIPLIMPIDQESMVRAVQLESKISKGLYTRLGEDVDLLKRKIVAQVSRGISTGMTYAQVAKGLSDYTRIGFNNAVRIARTEGHRIQNTAAMDTMYSAKEKGADIVKQWDATLDGATRESHAKVDGEIRELDKPFSNGLMFAGDPNGGAAEVVNCRCATLQRARAAFDEEELKTLQDRAAYFGLDKSDQFDDFKKKYLKAVEEPDEVTVNKYGQMIQFDKRFDDEKWTESKTIIQNLSKEYDTRLTTVKIGAANAAGDVDMGGVMRLSSAAKDAAIHEFAHSIAIESLTKYGVTNDSDFWKEIKSIKRAYRKEVGDDSARWISSYEHGTNLIDEFFAEAFTLAKMRQMGLQIPSKYGADFTYSTKVLEIVDKYFKKNK